MRRGLSLAKKCLLLFGVAIILIMLAAVWAPWLRMAALIDAGQLELSRHMVETWRTLGGPAAPPSWPLRSAPAALSEERANITARSMPYGQFEAMAKDEAYAREALRRFAGDPAMMEYQDARWVGTSREYRYVRRVTGAAGPEVVILERRSVEAAKLLLLNTAFLAVTGGGVGALAMLVLYVITRRLILAPVKALRATAERVREGNLAIRSGLKTGDEFQELGETFDSMLNDLQSSQDRLRSINAAMDLKLHELAESNMTLFQAAKVKGEFLANVSHELRTPLNAINGFAELLMEQARSEQDKPEPHPALPKRVRYLENILAAGRGLLALINSLLEMARIEAGKTEVRVERMNLRDACEGLVGLIAPIAAKKGVAVTLEVAEDVPVISTDASKFQQIIFNFLANAVKFTEPLEKTGREPRVILRVERLVASGGEERVRVSVIDNGPGIPSEEQGRIFEKFYQLDGGHTREHTGTGLGLAISKELASILQCEIQLLSEPGGGSMFSLIMPFEVHHTSPPESALEAKFRGALTGGREWE